MDALKLITNKHHVGVEIEIEKARSLLAKTPLWWVVKEDGSLRNNGYELVFKIPYKGQDVISAVGEAYTSLINNKMQVSPRTGIHVHVDVRDLNIKTLKKLCILYALTEEPLFKWVGDHRDSNSFCLPWYEADGDIEQIAKILSKDKANITLESRRIHRYSACNLHAISKFGSIEFRHLQTTMDPQRLVTWINLLLCLKVAALEAPTPDKILEEYQASGRTKFIKNIFGPLASKLDASSIDLGVLLAKELVFGSTSEVENNFFAHLFKQGVPEGYEKFKEVQKRPKAEAKGVNIDIENGRHWWEDAPVAQQAQDNGLAALEAQAVQVRLAQLRALHGVDVNNGNNLRGNNVVWNIQ